MNTKNVLRCQYRHDLTQNHQEYFLGVKVTNAVAKKTCDCP